MSIETANQLVRARKLLADMRTTRTAVIKASGLEREQLRAELSELAEQFNQLERWAREEAQADLVESARRFVSTRPCTDEEESRLMRWAVDRSGG